MDLDDLKLRWQELDRRLDDNLRLHASLMRGQGLDRMQTALERLVPGVVVELALSVIAVMWLASRVAERIDAPRFALPAALLFLGSLALVISGVGQLARIRAVDHGAPVVELQRRLDRLRVLRIAETGWVFLLAPLAWTPLLIVGLDALHVDAYQLLGTTYLLVNLLATLAWVVGAYVVARRFADRAGRSPRVRRFLDAIAGRSLAAARAQVDALAAFETGA